MITGYYCTNIFSEQAKDLIEFYRQTLEIPFIKTDDDNSNGVYLGFIENACNVQPTGHQSFVFQTKTLDLTMKRLKEKRTCTV